MKDTKITPPDEVAIEIIVWKDHSSSHNDKIDLTIFHNISIGANIYEDDEQVVLFQEGDVEKNPFEEEQNDAAQILKATIVSRKTITKLTWPLLSVDG